MGIGDFPCTLPSGHSGACSAVSQKEQEAGAARAARVQAPPAPTPKVELEWRRIPQASRPAILEMVRSTFTRERDTFKGTFRVARLADRNAFPERDAELRILDLRATVDASTLERRPANASDKYRLEEILSECISELGFDPRSQDDKGEPIPDGAALLEAILA